MSASNSRSKKRQPKKIPNNIAFGQSAIQNHFTKCDENSDSASVVKIKRNNKRRTESPAAIKTDPKRRRNTKSINEPSIASSDTPSPICNHLNDDCIMAIFEYLPLRDLCAVADVCKLFKSNAVSVFIRTFRDLDLNALVHEDEKVDLQWIDDCPPESDCEDDWEDGEVIELLPMKSVARLLRHFGAYILTIHLDSEDFDDNQEDQILELLTTYCAYKNSNLEKLVMHDIKINGYFRGQLRPIFNRLKYLDITGGSFDFASYNSDSQLSELILEDVDLGTSFVRKFKNLQTISFIDVSFAGSFDSFLSLNPQLKSLTITDSDGQSTWLNTHFISVIIELLPKLEQLKLDTKILSLNVEEHSYKGKKRRLQHLRVFSLNCFLLPISTFLNYIAAHNAPLEELDLRNFTLDDNIASALSKLSKMKKLRFSDGQAKRGELSNAVKGMPHLEKLCLINFKDVAMDDIKETIDTAHKLNELQLLRGHDELITEFIVSTEDFNRICQLVSGRGNSIRLNLHLSGPRCELNVPQSIIDTNSLVLQVTVVTFNEARFMNMIDYYQEN